MNGIGGSLDPHSQLRPKETFDVQNKKIDVPNAIILLHYSYVVVGNHLDVSNAIQGINRTIRKYIKVQDQFDSKMIDQYKEIIDRIKTDTAVYVSVDPSTITYLGKSDNIKEAQQAIKEFSESQANEKVSIPLEDRMHRFVEQKKADLKQIARVNNVRSFIAKDCIQLTGTKVQIKIAEPLVKKFVMDIESCFVTETVINKDQCVILQQMIKEESFKDFNVIIKKFGGQSSASYVEEDKEEERKIYNHMTHSVMVAQWSYEVKITDRNWRANFGGYVDFDPDQNF